MTKEASPTAKPNKNDMKSYNDLLAQMRRIDRLWSESDFDPRYDELYLYACGAFFLYKQNLQYALARYDRYGHDAGKGAYWPIAWDDSKDIKVSRSVYAGF